MFAKIDVNGDGAAPLYQWLTSELVDDDGNQDIGWNFAKFLVGKDGSPLKRFHPKVTPEEIAAELPALMQG